MSTYSKTALNIFKSTYETTILKAYASFFYVVDAYTMGALYDIRPTLTGIDHVYSQSSPIQCGNLERLLRGHRSNLGIFALRVYSVPTIAGSTIRVRLQAATYLRNFVIAIQEICREWATERGWAAPRFGERFRAVLEHTLATQKFPEAAFWGGKEVSNGHELQILGAARASLPGNPED